MDWEIVYYSEDVQQTILAFAPGLQGAVHLTERMQRMMTLAGKQLKAFRRRQRRRGR